MPCVAWMGRLLVVSLVLALGSSASLAEKPPGEPHGKGKQQKEEKAAQRPLPVGGYFVDSQRSVVANYYDQQRKAGHCPPGLAKKNNGCMPPGQARKWKLGQPIPGDVVFYPLPRAVVLRIGTPPAGYRYVRVANDLLLIAIGSRLVVDAIEDLMAQ
jgi:hypothetical protein